MSIDPRLASKLDQALAAIKPNRAVNGDDCKAFVADIVKRCQTRATFGITLNDVEHRISPSQIRVSRTCVDLGPVRVRLGGILVDWVEVSDTCETFYSFYTADQDNDFESAPHRLTFAA